MVKIIGSDQYLGMRHVDLHVSSSFAEILGSVFNVSNVVARSLPFCVTGSISSDLSLLSSCRCGVTIIDWQLLCRE